MKKLKSLSNCTPREFIKQTNKIRHSVEKWLEITEITKIRARDVDINDNMTTEERENAIYEQSKKNLNDILDNVLDKYPDETLEVLGLMCFVEPEDIDKHSISEYLGAFNELMNDKNVIGFFSSLLQLVQTLTQRA